jgi:hypothetical protein
LLPCEVKFIERLPATIQAAEQYVAVVEISRRNLDYVTVIKDETRKFLDVSGLGIVHVGFNPSNRIQHARTRVTFPVVFRKVSRTSRRLHPFGERVLIRVAQLHAWKLRQASELVFWPNDERLQFLRKLVVGRERVSQDREHDRQRDQPLLAVDHLEDTGGPITGYDHWTEKVVLPVLSTGFLRPSPDHRGTYVVVELRGRVLVPAVRSLERRHLKGRRIGK